jgi:hypothetical protein
MSKTNLTLVGLAVYVVFMLGLIWPVLWILLAILTTVVVDIVGLWAIWILVSTRTDSD